VKTKKSLNKSSRCRCRTCGYEYEYGNGEIEEARKHLKLCFPVYALTMLQIRTKEQGVIPFKLNDAQTYIHEIAEKQMAETGRVRIIVLKGRQQGMSTYIEGRFYWKVTHKYGIRAYILTHESDATANLSAGRVS